MTAALFLELFLRFGGEALAFGDETLFRFLDVPAEVFFELFLGGFRLGHPVFRLHALFLFALVADLQFERPAAELVLLAADLLLVPFDLVLVLDAPLMREAVLAAALPLAELHLLFAADLLGRARFNMGAGHGFRGGNGG